MKTRTQKLISLVLVLMMLVTMIPAGIFSANAAVSAELAAGLADIENTTEFVINNVDDWKAVAAVSNQFIGKTIKLGADIDAQGETLPQLFAAGNVRTTLDGQGYTIKNVGTAELPNMTALLSNKSNLNVYNLKVDNCHVAGTGNKGILVDWQNCWAKYTFKNITIANSSVVAAGYAGAVIAYMSGNGAGYGVDFENIIVSGCSIEGNAGVAALIGYTYLNATDYGSSAKNIEVLGTTITDNTAASCAAGLYGFFRHHKGSTLTIENAYVNATFLCPSSTGWTGVDTAFFQTGNSSIANKNVNTIKNTISNCAYASGVVQSTTLFYATQADFLAENNWSVQDQGKAGMMTSGTNTVNGAAASGYNGAPTTKIAASLIPHMITRNADGFISNVAMPTGLAMDLINYASVSTFVIKSVEDWNMIANSGKNFSDKVVQLGNDIDAKGATLLPLAPFAVNNSSITLDGNGYAIKNVGTAEAPQTQPLVSEKFSGGTVKNVTFQNVTLVGADATYGSGLIADWLNGWGAVTVQNVKVLGCSITDTAGAAGALFGRTINNNGDASENISGIIIDAETTISGATHAGGVIGHISGNGGIYNINRVYTAATLTAPAATGYVGGLVGYATGHASYTCAFNFNNNVVRGELYADGGSGWTGRIGGIAGRFTNGIDITVRNNILAPTAVTSGLTLCQTVSAANGGPQNLIVQNNYSAQMFMSVYYAENGNSKLDGVAKASGHWYNADVPGMLNLGKGEGLEAKIASLYKTDANGFVTTVQDHIDAEAIQVSAVENGTYAVRFIALSQLAEATDVNMVVKAYVKDAEGNVILAKLFDSAASTTGKCELYDYLTVYGEKGITKSASAAAYGAAKLAGFTIYDIPTGNAITFEVTTSYVDANGVTVTGANTMTVNFDAAGALIK